MSRLVTTPRRPAGNKYVSLPAKGDYYSKAEVDAKDAATLASAQEYADSLEEDSLHILSYELTSEIEALSTTRTGQRIENQERANAQYVLAPAGYVAQPGDITAANGRVWQLQADTQNDAVNFSNELRALNTPSEISQAVENSGKINNIRKSLLDSPLCRLFCPNKLVDTLAGSLTATRATTATYVDRYGVVRTAAIDEPREEKDGWLIEGASTNLLTYSEQFDNAAWVKNGTVTITPNATTAPDGSLTADRIQTTGISFISQSFALSGNSYTLSFWVKSGGTGQDTFRLLLDNNSGGDFVATSEWVRYERTVIPTGTFSSYGFSRPLDNSAMDVYIWGAQLEQLPFATSYIPTTTAPATRAADVVSANGQNNQPETSIGFSFTFDVNLLGRKGVNGVQAAVSSTAFTYFADNQFIGPNASSSTVIGTDNQLISTTTGLIQQVAMVSDNNSQVLYLSGTQAAISSLSSISTTPSTIYFGAVSAGANALYGHIKDLRIYDFALNEDEIAFLSGVK